MYLVRHHRSRSFCEELHKRDPLFAITLLPLHAFIIQQESSIPARKGVDKSTPMSAFGR
jgi:hypothetical protein